jgi:hypothetical protein
VWTVILAIFIAIMSAADRAQPERYLMPIMPALWLLGSRAIIALLGYRWWMAVPGFACLLILPLIFLVRFDYESTQPDTRVLAKEWIEAHVPSGAKILMDGMRYRFIMSPPINPNDITIADQAERAAQEGARLGRGLSKRALALYTEAMRQVEGPTYELHSTVYGLEVEELSYYVQACFDYIITSSTYTQRYTAEADRQRFPKSAQFYDQLRTDPRFEVVYTVEPVPWQNAGPTITVYKVLPGCSS